MAASPEICGRLRSERVMLTGAKHQPPNDSQIPELLNEFFSQLATGDEFDPVQVATWAHWCIARIHPFMDGNGRMSRLWQD
jgi:Fic family protein